MSKKEKTLKGIKTPSRRKFFKAAAAALPGSVGQLADDLLEPLPSYRQPKCCNWAAVIAALLLD